MYGMETRRKVIGIDFDETITLAPDMWLNIMKTFELNGFDVFIVTWRKENEWPDDFLPFTTKGYKVFFTARQAKHRFMADKGIHVDVWIDDNPSAILFNMGEERT